MKCAIVLLAKNLRVFNIKFAKATTQQDNCTFFQSNKILANAYMLKHTVSILWNVHLSLSFEEQLFIK